MNFLSFILVLGLLSIGYYLVTRLREISSVPFFDFWRRLSNSTKERDISVIELENLLDRGNNLPLLIDLRERNLFERGHINGAISLPFDEFMHEVLVNEKYAPTQKLILICDHGMKSKVAAEILGEDEKFSSVLSVKGGMEAWNKLTNPEYCCAGLFA